MDPSVIVNNFLTPPILFFLLGVFATLVKSDLEIPTQVARFLSLYLLFAIGLHGGHELAASTFNSQIGLMLGVAILSSLIIPLWSFALLRKKVGVPNAAAIAATYGSVSAVTFIAGISFLNSMSVPFGGHMIAAMALMESPAIVVGVLLSRYYGDRTSGRSLCWKELSREAFLNGSVLVLMGSLFIGLATGDKGWETLKPFAYDPFKGVLCIFLLDMGLVAAKRLKDLRESGIMLIVFGVVAAFVHAMLGIFMAKIIGAPPGDALLLAILFGGASYIAVPAAVRLAIPKANPSLYVPMALGVTFPFNVIIGIPLYYAIIQALWETPS